MTQQTVVGQGHHITEASRSQWDKPHSLRLLWKRNWPVTETSAYKDTTLKSDKRHCYRRDSNPQSQKASDRRHTGIG